MVTLWMTSGWNAMGGGGRCVLHHLWIGRECEMVVVLVCMSVTNSKGLSMHGT